MSGDSVEFTGGAFGHDAKVAVATAELVRLAGLCERVDAEVGASAEAAAALLLQLRMELIRCAVYAPLATARLDGLLQRHAFGSWWRSVEFTTVAGSLRLAAARYDEADAAVTQTFNAATDAADMTMPIVVGGVAVWQAGRGALGSRGDTTGGVGQGVPVEASSTLLDDLKAKGMDAVNHTDPRLIEHLVNGLGVWSHVIEAPSTALHEVARKGEVRSTSAAVAELAASWHHGGDAQVTSVIKMPDEVAPASVAALVATLNTHRRPVGKAGSRCDSTKEPPGRVDVLSRTVTVNGQGRRSHVVVLQGTSAWNVLNPSPIRDIRDAQANLQLRAGIPTAEMKAMPAVLQEAGVGKGDDVHFVGFSQGGATAAALSGYPEITKTYNVRSVVTAGGPVGGIHIPDQVTAVHLQDHKDPVPALDGEAASQRVNELTMGFEGVGAPGVPRHDEGNYVHGAGLFDAAADSVAAGNTDDGARGAAAARQRLVEVGALARPGENAVVQVTRVNLDRNM